MFTRSLFAGILAVAGVGLTAPASTAQATGPVHLAYTFDRCLHSSADCAGEIQDDSGNGNTGSVVTATDGELKVVPGASGAGAQLTAAIIRLESSPDYNAFNPGTRSFAFGAAIKTDTALTAGANVIQRGAFSDVTSQFKLQLDPGSQGCVIKGNAGRVLIFSPTDLPADNRWHSVMCVVTSEWIAYVVDGHAYSAPNTVGSVTFSDGEKLEIGGRLRPDGTIKDQFPKALDDVFFSSW